VIECTNCGFLNEDDDHFCGGCREPLQWTGRRIEEQPDEIEEEPDEPEARRGVVERVVDRLTGAEGQPAGSPDGGTTVAEPTVTASETAEDEEDAAAALSAEAVARAEREAAEAERLQQEAEAQAREQTEATERARAQAEEARRAREEAEAHAREEAAEAERIRAELEAAKVARQQAQEELRREVEEAEQAKAETRLQAEREAMERTQAELERAEAARREAEARAEAEAAAAEAAARQAAEAEQARLAAEAKAKADADAAAQARRAAALVARPKPKPEPKPEPKPKQPEPKEPRAKDKAATQSTTTGPTPVKPDVTRVRKAPPKTREATRRLRPGDLVCGQCGEGNTPTRNFCRRCGNTLAEAEVVKRPWWKRWIPQRKPRVIQAGARPGRGGSKKGGTGGVKGAVRGAQGVKRKVMGPIGKITRVLMLVGFAAAAVGLTFNPSLRGSVMGTAGDLFDRVRGVVAPQFDPVTPIAAEASSARSDQADGFCCSADNVLQFGNTWWHASEGGVGQSLTIILDSPTNVAKFGIIPGAGDPAVWPEHPRPRDLEVDFLDETGRTVATLSLADIKDEHESTSQIFDVSGADDVIRIRVTITRVYGEGLDSDDVAISEIRLLTRR
jgi:hypothetical protein